jgi:hypothetical protein
MRPDIEAGPIGRKCSGIERSPAGFAGAAVGATDRNRPRGNLSARKRANLMMSSDF